MSLSVVKGVSANGNPPTGVALSGSIGIGQLVLAFCEGGNLPGSATVSDTVNSGNYTLLASYLTPNLALYYKIANASGTPTVSVATTGGFAYIWAMGVTGFVGTPTIDAGLAATNTGTGTTASINATSNFANEIMLVNYWADNYTPTLSGNTWSSGTTGSGNTNNCFYAIEAAPTTNNFGVTLNSSQTWYVQLAGIYDLVAGVAPPSPFYYRKNVLYFI